MKRSIIFLVVLVMGISAVFSQEEVFKVLVMKGGNQVFRGGKWLPLATSAKIYRNEKIKVVDGGYLGLVNPAGKTTELPAAGVYDANALSLKLTAGNNSFVKKYANSLATDFSNSKVWGEQKTRMDVTGSVERGGGVQPVLLFMPAMTKLYEDNLTIKWFSNKWADKNYSFTIKKIFADTIFETIVPDTTLTLSLAELRLEPGQVYAITIAIKGVDKSYSNPMIIKVPNIAERDTVTKELSQMMADMGEPNAMDQLIIATYFEKNQMYTSAMIAYNKAIAMQPNIDYYKEAYQDFIDRNKIGAK